MYGWTIPSDEVILRLRKDLARTGYAASRQLWQYPPDPSRLKSLRMTQIWGRAASRPQCAIRPKTSNCPCVPIYTFPLATVGTANFTALPAAPAPVVGLLYS